MTEKNHVDGELDAMIEGITQTTPTPKRVNLEAPAPASKRTEYVSFESEETPVTTVEETPVPVARVTPVQDQSGATRVMDPVTDPAQDVRIFDGSAAETEETADADEPFVDEDSTERSHPKPREHYTQLFSACRTFLYIGIVLVVAATMAWYASRAVKDVFAFGQDPRPVDILVEDGDTSLEIAQKLYEKGVIQDPLLFRAYCRFTKADASFHPGNHTVHGNDGYNGLVNTFQTQTARDVVQVTIPEGSTVDSIAKLLEENNVCSAEDFYATVNTTDYDDYSFIAELSPTERANRVYVLEGYLFPDTYEFLQECSPDTAIRKMLDNFNTRVNENTRAQIKASGYTLDEVLVMASIVQREAGNDDDMPRVSRVTRNRLERDTGDFAGKLQMDSTREYAQSVNSTAGTETLMAAYNTYDRQGLPVGAICNPGLAAINAVVNPSTEENIINCYYFASIIETGETQFFETLAAHEAFCREHGIGAYG